MTISTIMNIGPVIPVVVVNRLRDAIPLVDALIDGGISTIEVTLRSEVALEVINLISKERPNITLGAGTVITIDQMRGVKEAGADFAVSPGCYLELLRSAAGLKLPFLPGASTASEMMLLMANNINAMKFFPATVAGGPDFLKAMVSPLQNAVFCPTGGITLSSASNWLALPNVACVGGSWVATRAMLDAGDFDAVTTNALACGTLIKKNN